MPEIRTTLLMNYLDNLTPYLGKQHPVVDLCLLAESYNTNNLAGICKSIKTQMGIRAKIRLCYVDNEGTEEDPPCWVGDELRTIPSFTSLQFADFIANVYIRRPRFEDMFLPAKVFAIAHELTHIVLAAKRCPLFATEEAVDVGAMLLGYGSFYAACKHEHKSTFFGLGPFQTQNTRTCSYGYLSIEEILFVQCLLGR